MSKRYLNKEKSVVKTVFRFFTVLIMFFLSMQLLSAQPCPPGPGGVPDCDNDEPGVPFDGGASILLGGGIALGVRKLYGKIRKK